MIRRLAFTGALLAALSATAAARAGTIDPLGDLQLDPDAVVVDGYEKAPARFLPDGTDMKCQAPGFEVVTLPDAMEGKSYLALHLVDGCAERLPFAVPPEQASYRATVWTRHGGITASVVIEYADGFGLDGLAVQLSPTGRTTSDGWVELATNDFPVDGAKVSHTFLKVVSYASRYGVDLDGFEILRHGVYSGQSDCKGLGDPACSTEEVCIYNRCVLGRAALPVLPSDALRDRVVDVLEGQLRVFYGGRRSRALYLPAALAELSQMRSEKTAWTFWSRWATAVHALHDWHTDTDMGITGFVGARHRLNACFIEGDADVSHGAWPKDPKFADLLVSHAGPDAAGLEAGDRLVAVDGQHPIAWAAALGNVNWGYHVATDPDTFSDFAEGLGGPTWSGGALIVQFAHELTVLRCDLDGTCGAPETIQVTDLGNQGGGPDVACDNRPFYHFDDAHNPDPTKHYVFGDFYRGAIAGTAASEAIYGMVWDTLYGGGDPHGWVNSHLNNAVADWKASARGVILDHRAGNGGTLESATNLTKLVRPPGVVAVTRMPAALGDYPGPADATAGLAIFDAAKGTTPYPVGDADWAQGLPVALIIHRDGSASDYLPFGMKGSPSVRIFGPHPTSGAFSTYIEFSGWGSFYYQVGSGDTIGADGSSLIGHGVAPDVTLLPRQSDLLAGKDTLFEAALAWVRKELKP
jgi:hypothetical protein